MNILFVCTGNTCRSPMAEGFFNAISEKAGLPHRASSCGTDAIAGDAASDKAIAAAKSFGVSLEKHRSRRMEEAVLQGADLIYCMSPRHRISALSLCPGADGRTFVLSPPIPDPYGRDDGVYAQTAEALYKAAENIVNDLRGRP